MIDAVSKQAITVPSMVRQKAAHLGKRGEEWLAGLADLIADVRREWSITLGPPLCGGTASYVARVRTADGLDAVVKLAVPDGGFDSQVRTIADASGCGYVGMLACDLRRQAMLLESLGPSVDHCGLSPQRTIEVLCQTLDQAWRVPRPTGLTVTPAEDKAEQLAGMVARLWQKHGHPCSRSVLARALRFAERRAAAFDLDDCVVVHGDPHPGNALRVLRPRAGAESGFVFVDPDGFLADPAYDLGVVLRDWCPQLLAGDAQSLAHHYCTLLATRTGIDPTAIWEWGFLERVSTGLYLLDLGAEDLADCSSTPPNYSPDQTAHRTGPRTIAQQRLVSR